MTIQELHDSKIEATAMEYRSKGYTVVVEPTGKDLPSFLKGLEPDLIATKGEHHVVVEVKNKSALRTSDSARHMADLISSQKGWEFQLVLLSEEEAKSSVTKSNLLSREKVEHYLNAAQQAKANGNPQASFVMSWVAVEAALRILAHEHDAAYSILSPRALIKDLSFQGVISAAQFQKLDKLAQMRARVIHGFDEPNLSQAIVDELITMARLLVSERASENADD